MCQCSNSTTSFNNFIPFVLRWFLWKIFFFCLVPLFESNVLSVRMRLTSNHKRKRGERKYRTRWWMVNYRRVSSRKNLGSKKWNENETKRDATQLTCFAAALVFVGRNSRSQDAAGWFLATLDGLPRRGLNQSRRRFRSINVAFDHRQNAAAAVPILHELHQGKMADKNQRINIESDSYFSDSTLLFYKRGTSVVLDSLSDVAGSWGLTLGGGGFILFFFLLLLLDFFRLSGHFGLFNVVFRPAVYCGDVDRRRRRLEDCGTRRGEEIRSDNVVGSDARLVVGGGGERGGRRRWWRRRRRWRRRGRSRCRQ